MPVTELFPASLPEPTSNFSFDEQPRINKAMFGDGYEQRSADGLNALKRVFSVEWDPLSETEKLTLVNFLRARGGWEGFLWTPPREATQIKVKCEGWRIQQTNGPWFKITATFEEIFDA